jgi:hypothetical protein
VVILLTCQEICGDVEPKYLCNHETCSFKVCGECLNFSHRGSKKTHLPNYLSLLTKEQTKLEKYEELYKKGILTELEFLQVKEKEDTPTQSSLETIPLNLIETPLMSSDAPLNDILLKIFNLHYLKEFEKIHQICENCVESKKSNKIIECFYAESLCKIQNSKRNGVEMLIEITKCEPDDIMDMFAIAKANMILQNNESFVFWLKTSSQNGNPFAQFTLAQCKCPSFL